MILLELIESNFFDSWTDTLMDARSYLFISKLQKLKKSDLKYLSSQITFHGSDGEHLLGYIYQSTNLKKLINTAEVLEKEKISHVLKLGEYTVIVAYNVFDALQIKIQNYSNGYLPLHVGVITTRNKPKIVLLYNNTFKINHTYNLN